MEQASQHLETLRLKQAVEALENSLDAAAREQLTYPEMLAELLGVEVTGRREGYLSTRTKMAHLPFQITLDQFDFAFQPSIDERPVKELANPSFVTEATNLLLLLGPPGVGKIHLAVAFALRAIENGQGAYFVRAYDLMEDLRKARIEHNLDRRMKMHLAPKVLILDEFGIRSYDRECATAFLTLVSLATNGAECYSPPTRASSNGANFWGMRSSPPLLRSHVLNIRGERHRLKDKRQARIFASHQQTSSQS